DLYDRTRVFVRLGFNESGTGQAILEAIGHGCPVVISRSLGAASLIKNGKHGFLVNEMDLSEVAKKVIEIYGDDHLFQSMSDSAYDLARMNGWDNYLEKLRKIILS
ncbi:MAG: glycosyltransferase, partial [Nitrososphaerota archaeon]